MDEISFTAAAKADLAAIDEYSAIEFGHDVADEYSRGFTKAFNLLRDHPHVGAAYPELGKGIRCLTHPPSHFLYCPTQSGADPPDRPLCARCENGAEEGGKMIGERWKRKAREIFSKNPDSISEHIDALDW